MAITIRTTLAAAESSGLRSLSAQDPDRRPPQRTGMLHEPRRNHAKHQQAAEQRLDSGKANQNKDDADDADDDGEGDDNGVDDNYGEEETTAFLALPDAETDTRDNAAKMVSFSFTFLHRFTVPMSIPLPKKSRRSLPSSP